MKVEIAYHHECQSIHGHEDSACDSKILLSERKWEKYQSYYIKHNSNTIVHIFIIDSPLFEKYIPQS